MDGERKNVNDKRQDMFPTLYENYRLSLPRCGCERLDEGATIIIYLLTYLLTPWSRVLLEKLTSKLCS